jgi:tetratricopeptide (TPR) repeat protein
LQAFEELGDNTKSELYQELHYLIAVGSLKMGSWETAKDVAEKMLKTDPRNMDAAFMVMGYCYDRGNRDRFFRAYYRYLKCRKKYLEHPEKAVGVVHTVGKHPDAVRMYNDMKEGLAA